MSSRLCYAFSKKIENHRAAVALNYAWHNLGTVVKTLRVTPAMQLGITDHIWAIEEFHAALVAAVPCEVPKKQALVSRVPETTARAFPNGRGFLRVVDAAHRMQDREKRVKRKKNRATRKDAPDKTKIVYFDSCGTSWGMIVHTDDQIAYGDAVHVTRNGHGCVARLRKK